MPSVRDLKWPMIIVFGVGGLKPMRKKQRDSKQVRQGLKSKNMKAWQRKKEREENREQKKDREKDWEKESATHEIQAQA